MRKAKCRARSNSCLVRALSDAPAERSAGSAGREASSEEQSERDAEGQVSSAKQFATGARSAATSEEQSNADAEAESAEHGANRKERAENSTGRKHRQGAIQVRCGRPSIERGAIREWCEALKC